MDHKDPITRFYLDNLPGSEVVNKLIRTACPFCSTGEDDKKKQIVVFLNQESFFHGYFRCLSRCRPGGFPLHFARMKNIEPSSVPGYDPDRHYAHSAADYPAKNYNSDIIDYSERLSDELYIRYKQFGINEETLSDMRIGYNGRYLVYPYVQDDGNCYSARCVHPDRPEDLFWHGDETFAAGSFKIFNSPEIERCENGTLFIVEGEDNLLTLKQLGLPGIAVAAVKDFAELKAERLTWIRTIFLCVNKNSDSDNAARELATRLGFKVRLIRWPETAPKNYCLTSMAAEDKENFSKKVYQLIKEAKAFSPFASPAKEFISFTEQLELQGGEEYKAMLSGFPALDKALGGIHGINILGGTPKTGKSCFLIQIAAEMARKRVPVLYYDFENGRQKIYQRTLSRISRLSIDELRSVDLPPDKQQQLSSGKEELRKILPWFRVITDRHLTPEIMRRHID
ncbi:MAG: DnaB helicase C-terminal domain-containing protein, partial [Desulfobulbaceae bacterium]|nr:DnaB helicase C-terminal domain-containing protein [Desulfobulbaceae bacterium]